VIRGLGATTHKTEGLMDEQNERVIAAEERAEAEAEARRAAEEANRVECVRMHEFRKKLSRRQTEALAACASVLAALDEGSTFEDEPEVETARRRVLNALTESFFDPPVPATSPWLTIAETLRDSLPDIAEALANARSVSDQVANPGPGFGSGYTSAQQTPPASSVTVTPGVKSLLVGHIVSTPFGVMKVIETQFGVLGLIPVTPERAAQAVKVDSGPVSGEFVQYAEEQRSMLMRAAQMVHTSIVNGDSPASFVGDLVETVPSSIWRQFCERQDDEICAAVRSYAPSTAGATPAGQAFIRTALALLREENEDF